MIELRDIAKTYPAADGGVVEAVVDATLDVASGEFLIVVGRSGSGKTTLLNLMAGLTRPTSGRVTLDGVDLWSSGDAAQSRLRNEAMGFVFQFPSLLPFLTVEDNLVLPTGLGAGSNRGPAD